LFLLNRGMKKYRNKTRKYRGGAATALPLKYFNPSAAEPDATAGRDLLKAMPPLGIRPRIGGKRRTKRVLKKRKTQKGGFVPSIMDGFVAAASKYIVPVALYAGYRLMTRKQKRRASR
jgi:hypothetical protein